MMKVSSAVLAFFLTSEIVLAQGGQPEPLRVTRFYNFTSTANSQIDNRNQSTRSNNYHSFCATGVGTWSATLQYSEDRSTWTNFPESWASVNNTSTFCYGSGFGYHAYIRFNVVGNSNITYSGSKDYYIVASGGGGGGGVTSVVAGPSTGISAVTSVGVVTVDIVTAVVPRFGFPWAQTSTATFSGGLNIFPASPPGSPSDGDIAISTGSSPAFLEYRAGGAWKVPIVSLTASTGMASFAGCGNGSICVAAIDETVTEKFYKGSGTPGNISGVKQGNIYLDTATGNQYICNASSPPCTAVTAGNWVLVSGAGGGAVSSVSAGSSALTISPTTGAVVADINTAIVPRLSVTNTWTGFNDMSGGSFQPPTTTVASLPSAASATNKVYQVTNAVAAGTCTTGGSNVRVLCLSDGTSWYPTGGVGSGGVGISYTSAGAVNTVAIDESVTEKFFKGSGVPTSVTSSKPGNIYLNTATGDQYICNHPTGPCTTVATANWVGVSGAISLTSSDGTLNVTGTNLGINFSLVAGIQQNNDLTGSNNVTYNYEAESIVNDSGTGTATSKLVKYTGVATARTILTTDTSGILGVCVSSCANFGTARVATRGTVSCAFDGATTANHYVGPSSSTAGNCTDAGATRPVTGQVLGFVTSTNGGSGTYTVNLQPDIVATNNVVASGTLALGTSAISSGACATAVTSTATGTLSTDVVSASFNGDPTAITGYVPATSGMLTIILWPSSNLISAKACNNTASSITPGAVTLNYAILRR